MLARYQQFTVFTLLALALLWVIVFASRNHPIVAFLGALFILFAYALVLALEMLVASQVNRSDTVSPATAAMLLNAWWGEVRCAARVFFWSQPFRSHIEPDRLPAAGVSDAVGVVFVHGLVCNRGIWNPWLGRLGALGIPFVAVNLEPVFADIESYTPAIDAAVRRVQRATGRPPIIVAHSMGGLAVRAWLAGDAADSRVQDVICLGTPHHGTLLAWHGLAANVRQMRRDSTWLATLARREPTGRNAKFTCYFSHCDNIVIPASSATLPGADNRHLSGVGHVQMASEERIFLDIVRRSRQELYAASRMPL